MRPTLKGKQKRWFGHPVVVVGLLALIVADYISIPGGYWRGGSMVKSVLEQTFSGRSVTPRMFPAFFVTDGQQIELLWDWHQPIPGHLTFQSKQRSWQSLGWPDYQPWKPHGFYHITRFERSFDFRDKITPEQRAQMMALFVERFDALPPGHEFRTWPALHEARRLYANGKTSELSIVPLGYYRNTVTLTLLALLVVACKRGRTDLHLRTYSDRLLKRPAPGHCPHCGYDIQDLTTCPECGSARSTNQRS